MADSLQRHIEMIPGARGVKARIAGHRIRVQDIAIWHEKLGMSADEIVHQYPTITLADVYAALAHYWDHKERIDRDIAEENTLAEHLRDLDAGPLARKLDRPPRG